MHGTLPNAFEKEIIGKLTPVVTAISGWFASMLAGAVFVEYIFGWNGLGKALVEALNLLDLPVVMGAVLVIGLLFVLVNIAVDLTYALIDPRLRIQIDLYSCLLFSFPDEIFLLQFTSGRGSELERWRCMRNKNAKRYSQSFSLDKKEFFIDPTDQAVVDKVDASLQL